MPQSSPGLSDDSASTNLAAREALRQALGSQELEGWAPTAEQHARLNQVAHRHLTYGRFMGPYLGEFRTPQTQNYRRPLFARRLPYQLPGSQILRNNFHVADPHAFAQLEGLSSAARSIDLYLRNHAGKVIASRTDVYYLHQQIFIDIFSWAGQKRTVGISKSGSYFAPVNFIDHHLTLLRDEVAALINSDRTRREVISRLAKIYARYNYAHPFREGNGRTGTLYLHLLAKEVGCGIDIEAIDRREWIASSRASLPRRHSEDPDHRPFLPIFRKVVYTPTCE